MDAPSAAAATSQRGSAWCLIRQPPAGRPKLLGITKRGSRYLRKLVIQGARAALPSLARTATPLGGWLRGLLARAHGNTVVVALASKLIRSRLGAPAQRDQVRRRRRSSGVERDRLAAITRRREPWRVCGWWKRDGLTVNRCPNSLCRQMALDAGPFIRTGTRGSPSWPGSKETGYVDADCSDQSAEAACRRGGPYVDGTLCGLAVDDRRRRARLAACVLPHLNIERVVDALQRPVPVPQVEVLPDGAARRQVLRQRLPLTPRPEHIKDRVEDLTNVHRSRAAAALGRTDQRSHQPPFGVRQITLVTQAAPVGRRSMFRLPHEAPPNQVPAPS